MIDAGRQAGYKITAFHHAVESYKIADILVVNKADRPGADEAALTVPPKVDLGGIGASGAKK